MSHVPWTLRRHNDAADSTPVHQFASLQELLRWFSSNPDVCFPITRLGINDAASYCVDTAVFGPTTASHTINGLDSVKAASLWESTAVFAMLQATTCHGRRSSPVAVGVFCLRMSSSSFTVGIVTEGSRNSEQVVSTVNAWLVSASTLLPSDATVETFVDLPICSGQRKGRIAVWWQQSDKRVTPGTPLPTIKVTVDVPTTTSNCFPFTEARLFLGRPLNSKLQGLTCQQLQPGKSVLFFTDVTVTATGEHLIVVEAGILPDFKPFVAPLTSYIPPFLVIPDAGL